MWAGRGRRRRGMPAAYQALFSEQDLQPASASFVVSRPEPSESVLPEPPQRSLPAEYRRPDISLAQFLDDQGRPIRYGHRWGTDSPPESTYSVVTHPERFAPVPEVARALVDHLSAHYQVFVSGDDWVNLDPAIGARLRFRLEQAGEVPAVRVKAGLLAERWYPDCGCDACDDDVAVMLEDLENFVFAVVQGDFAEWREGSWLYHGLYLGDAVSETSGHKVTGLRQRARLAARRLPGRYPAWPRR